MRKKLFAVYFLVQPYGKRQHVMPLSNESQIMAKLKKVYPGKQIMIDCVMPILGRQR